MFQSSTQILHLKIYATITKILHQILSPSVQILVDSLNTWITHLIQAAVSPHIDMKT